jgi:hypothetical protein
MFPRVAATGVFGSIGWSAGFDSIGIDGPTYAGPNAITNCQDNYCMFENCWDVAPSPSGVVSARARWREAPPGDGVYHTLTEPETGTISADFVVETTVPGGLMFFAQHVPGIDNRASHFIAIETGYDPTFWPGVAEEFEGDGEPVGKLMWKKNQ